MTALFISEHLHYAYPTPRGEPRPALCDLSFTIAEGEYVAIVGANGSGKSTLARHFNALLRPTQGSLHVAGMDTREVKAHRDIRQLVGMVFQRPEDQLVASIVADDVAFGLENLRLPAMETQRRVYEALLAVDLWDERDRPTHLLSAGQLQRAAFAGILAMRPRCIVCDEVTAMLDPRGREDVLALLRQLHADGLTIVTITHFMTEAAQADRVIVLDHGRIALDGPPQEIFSRDQATLQALALDLPPAAALNHLLRPHFPTLPTGLLTVDDLAAALDATVPQPQRPKVSSAPPVTWREGPLHIEVNELGHVYLQGTPLERRALIGIDLEVVAGAAHGLLGATGSGKSTLMQHLNGLYRPQEGLVRVAGYNLRYADTDVREVRRRVGLAFQQPELQIFEQYVGDEIAYGPRLQDLERAALRERVRWAMSLVGLEFEAFKDRLTFTLSGGERRKVALAAVLALRPEILLLDEPTAGLDPASRADLLTRLQALRESGMTLAISSHQMEDLALLTEKLTILSEGAVAMTGPTREVFAQGEVLRRHGLALPTISTLVALLRSRGWALPPTLITPAEFMAALGLT